MEAMNVLHRCLVVLCVALLLSLERLMVQGVGVSCSQGDGTAVIDGQLLRLRLGEVFILRCQRDPNHYDQLTNPTCKSMEADDTLLQYTWHCKVRGDAIIEIWGINSNAYSLMNLTVQAHNLDLDATARTTEEQTPYPSTTPPESLPQREDPTTDTAPSAGYNHQQDSPPSTDNQTTTFSKTKVDTNMMLSLKISVGVLVGLVLVLLVVVLIMALLFYRQCRRRKVAGSIEGQERLQESKSGNEVNKTNVVEGAASLDNTISTDNDTDNDTSVTVIHLDQ